MEAHYRHLINQARRQGNLKKAAELEALCNPPDETELPEETEFVWSLFLSLPRSVSAGVSTVIFQEIPFSEIEAMAKVRGIELEPWEAEALRRLDRLWIRMKSAELKEAHRPPSGGPSGPRRTFSGH